MDLIGRCKLRLPDQWKFALIAACLSLVLFAPVGYSHAFVRNQDSLTDFYMHQVWAVSLQKHGAESIPTFVLAHSAWQWLLVLLNSAFGFSFELAGFLGAIFSWAFAVAVIAFWYYPVLAKQGFPRGLGLLIVFGVSMAAPVAMLWPVDGMLYIGYIGMATYHSPTMLLLKPFAVLQLIFAMRCLVTTSPLPKAHIVGGILVSLLAAFIKPSFAICLLPALAILAGLRWVQKKFVDWAGLLLGIAIPTVLILAWQFLVTYYSSETNVVKLLPFEVMKGFSNFIALKFFLSVLFPLALTVVFFREVVRDVRMLLAWLVFIFGVMFTYLFAEMGPRMMEGNFTWSGEISMLLLFVTATLFLLEQQAGSLKAKRGLSFLWALHVIFGILYYSFAALHRTYF